MNIRDWWVLHFTHIENLPSIVQTTGLSCDNHSVQDRSKTQVGDVAIKQRRRRRKVPVGPGGVVADYVPFYFAPRSPMMYRIMCDRREQVASRYQGGDLPLVYLAARVEAVVEAGLPWVGTDGNAASQITSFTTSLDVLDAIVDWPLMKATMWHDTPEDADRQRRRMAELLVHQRFPLSLVHEVAAYDERVAAAARTALSGITLAERVRVRSSWYFGNGGR